MSDNRTAEEFQSDPNVREWLQTVDEQLYMAASTAKNLALSPSGTKGKMLIARVLEEYASQQTASLREENERLNTILSAEVYKNEQLARAVEHSDQRWAKDFLEVQQENEKLKSIVLAPAELRKNVSQLQEEVERLKGLLFNCRTQIDFMNDGYCNGGCESATAAIKSIDKTLNL